MNVHRKDEVKGGEVPLGFGSLEHLPSSRRLSPHSGSWRTATHPRRGNVTAFEWPPNDMRNPWSCDQHLDQNNLQQKRQKFNILSHTSTSTSTKAPIAHVPKASLKPAHIPDSEYTSSVSAPSPGQSWIPTPFRNKEKTPP